MKRLAWLQNRLPLHGSRSCLQTRKFATNTRPGADLKPDPQGQARTEPTGLNKPGQEDFVFDDTFEIDADEKIVNTAVGSLPMSPLLDPKWREARTRGKAKPLPDKSNLNRFRRQLVQNPYAQMLATPVRSCYVTRTRLPRAFLQSFGLVRHPETANVWWIPEYITQSEKRAPRISAGGQAAQPGPASEETTESSEAAAGDDASSAAETGEDKTAKLETIYRYPSHVLARQDLLQGFFVSGSKYKGGHFRLASNPRVSGLARSAIWREDMDTAIVGLSRRQIMHDLLYLSKFCEEQGRKYFVKVNDAKETGHFAHRSCFLWLGPEDQGTGHEGVGHAPGQYTTLDIDGHPETTRPVYNLPKLLGLENLQRLRSESSILREGELFLLRGGRTLKLNSRLWKLQGYMADYSKMK